MCGMLVALLYGSAGCSDNPIEGGPGGQFSEIETSIHQKVNAHRAAQGLPPLAMVSVMVEQSRVHSRNMAAGRTSVDHDGFQSRVDEIRKTVPLISAGENVAYNVGFDDPARKAVDDWLASPGHRRNIEGEFNVTGIGVERNGRGEYYFTQIFGKR